MPSRQLPVLLTGASGQLGRLVLAELLDIHRLPPDQIIATTRSPAALSEAAGRGVIVRKADFDEPEELRRAFLGAKRMLMISTTPEAVHLDGVRMRKQVAAIAAAVDAGVEHILYTSAPHPEPPTPCFWKADHYGTELALIASGVTWTILRNWDYPDWHLSEEWKHALTSGSFVTSRGTGRVNHVTREDCARAAAAALLSEMTANRRFDITGPQALTAEEIMATLAEVAGKPVKVVHCTPSEHEAHLVALRVEPLFIPFLVAFSVAAGLGKYGGVTDCVEELSGRRPTSLRSFLEDNIQRLG